MERIADRLWRHPQTQPRRSGWLYPAVGFFMMGPRSAFWRPSDSLDVPGLLIGIAWLAVGGSVLVQECAPAASRALRIGWIAFVLPTLLTSLVAFAARG